MSLIKEDIVLILICFFPQLPFLGFCTFTGLFNLTQHTARDLKLASFVASGTKEIQGHTASARCAKLVASVSGINATVIVRL